MCIRDSKDTDGKEISNYGEYTVESSDKTTLMILGNTMQKNNKVPVSYTHLDVYKRQILSLFNVLLI